ncbi:MAG: 5-(carboxyamino)imidazole ribonucleotide synthase [Candidatus Melainabacteria bacterium]|nr:5-(carboxyamino)imidazole ribonucleotide synthase [Candidatus Melainabacteria bacterium]
MTPPADALDPCELSPAILPGASFGILGGGQLGRMTAMAAKQLGYRVVVLTPERHSPAGQVCDREIVADYQDPQALEHFAREVSVVTVEFENIPAESLRELAQQVPVHPSANVLAVCQHRLREKTFLQEAGFAVTPFAPLGSIVDLQRALDSVGFPAVLKTAGFGYDGKGQAKINNLNEARAAYDAFSQTYGGQAIVEAFVPFRREISVIGARSAQGAFAAYGPVENVHRHHILETSLVTPDSHLDPLAQQAIEMTRQVMQALDVVGLLCVEFFETATGELLINELAPRPHNSGHYSLDACATSQFEQLVRAVCGLPLGSPQVHQTALMVNLLGDSWQQEQPPDWAYLLSHPNLHLHLYGKAQARAGRKMGHFTLLSQTGPTELWEQWRQLLPVLRPAVAVPLSNG